MYIKADTSVDLSGISYRKLVWCGLQAIYSFKVGTQDGTSPCD